MLAKATTKKMYHNISPLLSSKLLFLYVFETRGSKTGKEENQEEDAQENAEAEEESDDTVELAAPEEPPVWERPFLAYPERFGTVVVDPKEGMFVPLNKRCKDYQLIPHFADGKLRGYIVDSASHSHGVTSYWCHLLFKSHRAKPVSELKNSEVAEMVADLRRRNPEYLPCNIPPRIVEEAQEAFVIWREAEAAEANADGGEGNGNGCAEPKNEHGAEESQCADEDTEDATKSVEEAGQVEEEDAQGDEKVRFCRVVSFSTKRAYYEGVG